MTGALHNPRWKMVFGPRNRIVGAVVENPDGSWRATKGSENNLGTFSTKEQAGDFLIRRAAERDGGEP